MACIDFSKLPKFSDLPVRPGAPRDSAWGVFGDDDEVGCVNLLTQEGIVAAARLVKNGKAFRLDMPIGYGSPPLFGRGAPRHSIIRFSDSLGHDDQLDHFNTQEGSQWDGLGHAGDAESNAFYNGFKRDQIKRGPEGKLGIHHWANRLVGRGVLLDAFKYRADQGRPIDPGETDIYTIDDLENAAKSQGLDLKPADILLVRTGWLQHYLGLSPEEKEALGTRDGLRACGLDSSREMARWLWDQRVAALATDNPSVESWPWDRDRGSLHVRAIALLGLPLGEQFNLEELASDCHRDGVYEFMLVSAPLHLQGGIASPPNALAIK